MAINFDKIDEILKDTNETVEKPEEKKKPIYQSQDGFVKVPLLRGFTEIAKLYDFITPYGAVICGGYARYCASPRLNDITPAGDVDIYCFTEKVYEVLDKELKKHLTVKWENDISITFVKTKEGLFAYCPIIQLIKPVLEGRVVSVGTEEDILSNFDFTVIRTCIISPTEVLADADFLHDEEKKILRLKNIHCPVSSTLRCMKYSGKGYWLPPMQSLKLFMDWDTRGPEYRATLIDFIEKANDGEGLTKEEIDHMEKMMRID